MNDTPPDFNGLFTPDGEVKATDTTGTRSELKDSAFAPVSNHNIINTNLQTGAEFNVFFKNPDGFKCHMKLHAATGKAVLEQSAGVFAYLAAHDFVPEHSTAVAAAQVTREGLPQDGTASHTTCPIHHVPMERKENEHGVWYSHKTEDPAYEDKKGWCNGKPRS